MSQTAVGQTATMNTSHHDVETDIYLFKGDELPITGERDNEICCQHTDRDEDKNPTGKSPIWIPKEKVTIA